MSNLISVHDDVDDGLHGGHGRHYKMEQDGRLIMDLNTGLPHVMTEEEAMLRKAHGEYTDVPLKETEEPQPSEAGGDE